MWALGKLVEHKVFTNEQFSDISATAIKLANALSNKNDANSQGLANALWALGKLVKHKVFTNEQFSDISAAAIKLAHTLSNKNDANSQDCANALWALGKLASMNILSTATAGMIAVGIFTTLLTNKNRSCSESVLLVSVLALTCLQQNGNMSIDDEAFTKKIMDNVKLFYSSLNSKHDVEPNVNPNIVEYVRKIVFAFGVFDIQTEAKTGTERATFA